MQRISFDSLTTVCGGAGGVCTFNNNTGKPITVTPELPGRYATPRPGEPPVQIPAGGTGTINPGNYSIGHRGNYCGAGSTTDVNE
jgi:hypothetical protein